jgi:hypothetical protein
VTRLAVVLDTPAVLAPVVLLDALSTRISGFVTPLLARGFSRSPVGQAAS